MKIRGNFFFDCRSFGCKSLILKLLLQKIIGNIYENFELKSPTPTLYIARKNTWIQNDDNFFFFTFLFTCTSFCSLAWKCFKIWVMTSSSHYSSCSDLYSLSERPKAFMRIGHHFVVVAWHQAFHWMTDKHKFVEMIFGKLKFFFRLK